MPNKEKISIQQKKWRETSKEYNQTRLKLWRKDNKEHIATYKFNNKDSNCAHTAKRRADLLKATPPWADLEAIKEFYTKREQLTKDTGVLHHVDHIVPLNGVEVRGLHCENNLQILTASENLSKYNNLLIE